MSYIGPETTGTKFFNELPGQGNRWGQTEESGETTFFCTTTSR